jgi:hypothetical protein
MGTHTKTWELLTPWAETQPWECLIRETGCVSPTHNHDPMVGDECAVGRCRAKLKEREVCYAVTEIPRPEGGSERWVCWRHVRPDDGPIVVPS